MSLLRADIPALQASRSPLAPLQLLEQGTTHDALARAVVPVVAGILFFAALGGITYGIAVLVSHNTQGIKIGSKEFLIGRVDIAVARIEAHGPLLYADLKGTQGEQAIVRLHFSAPPEAPTTRGFAVGVLESEAFVSGEYSTSYLDEHEPMGGTP